MKLMLKITGGIILAVIVLTAGCAALVGKSVNDATKSNHAYAVKIDAAGSWSGSIGSASYDGSGPRTIRFKDMAVTSAVIQKQSGNNLGLKVTLLKDGKVLDSAKTTAAYGVVTVGGSDF